MAASCADAAKSSYGTIVCMSRSQSYKAVVLRTVDIGEADRFCILFTRERGVVPARARGVRKLKSKWGASLLASRIVQVELYESSRGMTIIGSIPAHQEQDFASGLDAFLYVQQAMELLLALLHEHEPLSEVYDVLEEFILIPSMHASAFLPFLLRIFHLLGLLPTERTEPRIAALSSEQHLFVCDCTKSFSLQELSDRNVGGLHTFVLSLLREHIDRPLKSHDIALQLLHAS